MGQFGSLETARTMTSEHGAKGHANLRLMLFRNASQGFPPLGNLLVGAQSGEHRLSCYNLRAQAEAAGEIVEHGERPGLRGRADALPLM